MGLVRFPSAEELTGSAKGVMLLGSKNNNDNTMITPCTVDYERKSPLKQNQAFMGNYPNHA